ncbi:DUF4389 domain-containing protein [Candidatus Pacearchaeota archaeon]|nr:DUF4389 domain-containing protein [Candidatus Pacearchaeota archaeon]
MGERIEALMRIIVTIVSGIILSVWKWFVTVLIVINFFFTLFAGRRLKEVAELSEIWNTQWYIFQRYIIFVSNKRPFPFRKLEKSMSKYEHNLHSKHSKN